MVELANVSCRTSPAHRSGTHMGAPPAHSSPWPALSIVRCAPKYVSGPNLDHPTSRVADTVLLGVLPTKGPMSNLNPMTAQIACMLLLITESARVRRLPPGNSCNEAALTRHGERYPYCGGCKHGDALLAGIIYCDGTGCA